MYCKSLLPCPRQPAHNRRCGVGERRNRRLGGKLQGKRDEMTATIYYVRWGKQDSYTCQRAQVDSEIVAMLNTEGVTAAWYTLN